MPTIPIIVSDRYGPLATVLTFMLLRINPEFDILSVPRCQDAWEHLRTTPRLIILDMEHDSTKCVELTETALSSGVAVMWLLKVGEEELVNVAARLGVRHWLHKPFTLEALRDMVNKALASR